VHLFVRLVAVGVAELALAVEAHEVRVGLQGRLAIFLCLQELKHGLMSALGIVGRFVLEVFRV